MKSLPIRIRLTVWYSVMFATAALLLGTASWWMLRRTIDATTHQDLQERIDDIRTQLHQFALEPGAEPLQARFDAIYRLRDDGKWLQILNADGTWVYRSSRMISTQASLARPGAIPAAGISSEFRQRGRHVRAFSAAISVDGHAYAVECGASINKQDALLRQFGAELLILTPLVLLAAVLAGHWLSRKALDPVAQIAQEARRIGDRNLDLRLPVSPVRDEVSHLSITLNNMLARIDAGYRSMRDFTANASHELRTPLARLRTEIEVALLRRRTGEEYEDKLLHLQACADEMIRLTENLLTLARAESGSAPLALMPVDLWDMVQRVHAEWLPVADRLNLTLTAGSSETPREPVFALGDEASLLRFLRILLDNACKFTPPGGTVAIGIELTDDLAVLSVQDSGIGIPEGERQRIFERFYRVHGDKGPRTSGSGLGLSLAAWIAEQHRTAVVVQSVPGLGSRFDLSLSRVANSRPNKPATQCAQTA